MLSALASQAVEVRLEGAEMPDARPVFFGFPEGRAIRAKPVAFAVPPFAVVEGYQVLAADGTVLFRDDITPPESFGARGGYFDLPDLTVVI